MKRADIVSPKYVLRDLVLKHGGFMGMTELLETPSFRRGYDANDIRRYVYELRKEAKGMDGPYGLEAWEMLDCVVIGLEKCLTNGMRWEINKRRQAKEAGVAAQNKLDNIIFQKRVKRKEINEKLEASSKALTKSRASSLAAKNVLTEYREEFK